MRRSIPPLLSLGLSALLPTLGGCDIDDTDDIDDFDTADSQLRTWTPLPPIPPGLCQEAEYSRPPTNGECEAEVVLQSTTFVTGQGISEGRGEISAVIHSREPPSNVHQAAWLLEEKYVVGETKGHDEAFAQYTIPSGQNIDIQVCAEFTEHDGGGPNGQDDEAKACRMINIACDPVDGIVTSPPVVLGPADFCGPNTCLGSAAATVQVMRADADGDGIPNIEDYTPEPCDEVNKGQLGVGLLLYYHYDDDSFTSLWQSVGTHLSEHYASYDYVVLLMDSTSSNSLATSTPAFTGADLVLPPTRDGLIEGMQELTSRGLAFDVFVHAHGYDRALDPDDAKFEVLEDEMIHGEWLVDATDPDNIGTARGGVPIVAFWGTTCWSDRQIDAWEEVGAMTASGAYHIQFHPNAWDNFWDNWVAGVPYRTSVDTSVTFGVRSAVNALMLAQSAWVPFATWPFQSCDGPLGLSYCADDFFNDDIGFDAAYDLSDVYDHNLSGRDNMDITSTRTFTGLEMTTFGGGAHVWP